MRHLGRVLAAVAALAIAPLAARSATYQVTPATLASFQKSTLPTLKCGDVVRLQGIFPTGLYLNGFHPAGCSTYTTWEQLTSLYTDSFVLFDYTQATVTAYPTRINQSDHFYIKGGTWGIAGNAVTSALFDFRASSQFVIEGVHALDGTGIGLQNDSVFRIFGNQFRHIAIGADAMDITSSMQGEVAWNSCLMLYSGKLGVHVDCLQLWNVPGITLTLAYLDIHDNDAIGYTQGYGSRFYHAGSAEPQPASYLTVNQNVEAITGWASDENAVTNSAMTSNTIFTILTSADELLNYCARWNLTDSTGEGADSGTTGNVFSGNNSCIPPNTAQVLASTPYMYAQIAAAGTDLKNQDAAANAAPGTAAAQAASIQAQADLAAINAWLAKINAAVTQDTTEAKYATSGAAYAASMAADAAKQAAAAAPAP